MSKATSLLISIAICFALLRPLGLEAFQPDHPTYLPFTSKPHYYYVAKDGSNSQPGSKERPWRTIQYAVNHVLSGDTILVRSGTYYENVVLGASGQANKLITLTRFGNEEVIIDGGSGAALSGRGSYWQISFLRITSRAWRTIYLEPFSHSSLYSNRIAGPIVIVGAYNLVQENDVDGSQHSGDENGIMDGSIESHHNQFIWNTVHDFYSRGIWSQVNTHDNIIDHNHVYNISGPYGACIDLDSAVGVTYRNSVQNNWVHDCGSIGIELENAFDTLVQNNRVSNSGVEGIVAINYLGCEVGGENGQYGSPTGDCRGVKLATVIRQNIIYNGGSTGAIVCYAAAGVQVIGNTVYGGESTGLYINDKVQYCNNWEVFNNIFTNHQRAEISVYSPDSLVIDQNNLLFHPGNNAAYQVFGTLDDFYNLVEWQAVTGLGRNSIEKDPRFVNPTKQDFHLSSTSPAIDQGIDPGIPYDFEGRSRRLGAGYDLGVYEFAAP